MSVLIEDHLPVVKYNGLNSDKAVVLGSTLAVTGGITATGGVSGAVAATTITASGATALDTVNYKNQVTNTGGAYATAIQLTAAQSGRVILVNDTAGLDFLLPAVTSTEVGVYFKFLVTVSVATNAFRVVAASGDIMFGGVILTDFDTADKILWCPADGSNDLTMSMNGTTTGGKMGTWVEFTCTSATQWVVNGIAIGDGTLATPFS